MTYEEYTAISEKIQESINSGALTMETAEMLNNEAYNKYLSYMEKCKKDKEDKEDKKEKCDKCGKEECECKESTYDMIADCIENVLSRGAITLETANFINDAAYEKYGNNKSTNFTESDAITLLENGFTIEEISDMFTEGAIADEKVFLKAITDSSKKYRESVKKIKKAIKVKDAVEAKKELEAGKASLRELENVVKETPSTFTNTVISIAAKAVLAALQEGLTMDITQAAINAIVYKPQNRVKAKQYPEDHINEYYKVDKPSFMAFSAACSVLGNTIHAIKEAKEGKANAFKRDALSAINKNMKFLDKIEIKVEKLEK